MFFAFGVRVVTIYEQDTLLSSLGSWMPPGSPLFLDGPWVASAGERPGFRLFGFFVLSKRMANKLQKVVQNGVQFAFKMLENPTWDCFFHFSNWSHFRRHGFSFIMLSGTIECIKIARKHCRVSQNRGSTVFHKIHKCLQKVLGMTPPMASKVRENQKYLNPGPSENTLVFYVLFYWFWV